MVIGIDFDNTLVNYDDVFFKRALELRLINDRPVLRKRQVRDRIRLLPEGELIWQQLQAYVYTQGMARAHLINGVKDFFMSCQRAGIQTFIVSHKTENLRDIASDWMKIKGFFEPSGLGLKESQVYFESTRNEKIERIKALKCTHFIDDLQEVFLEVGFPSGIKKVLYAPDSQQSVRQDIHVANSWERIYEYFFN